MSSAEIALRLSKKTLKEPEFDRAIVYALSYLEGLKVIRKSIDIELILLELSELDSRFLDGYCKEHILLKPENFNSNGTIFIGKNKCQEFKKSNYYGILQIRGRGI